MDWLWSSASGEDNDSGLWAEVSLFTEDDIPTKRPRLQQPTSNTYKIAGVPVSFPGKPYPNQEKIMENIIKSLEQNQNSLIESPTGSGKTLALLCAVLGWKKQELLRNAESDNSKKKIFYCTRTHAQINDVIKELRKTEYASTDAGPGFKVGILGGRKQMCVNETVCGGGGGNASHNIDDACSKLVRNFKKNRQVTTTNLKLPECKYFKEISDDFFVTDEGTCSEVQDIEDLRTTGKQQTCCPLFGSRRQIPLVDLIICPYNYIISSYIRKSLRIDLKNSIVIFDEGHNLENVLCNEGSMSWKDKMFAEIVKKCKELKLESGVSESVEMACESLSHKFEKFHHWLKTSEPVSQTQIFLALRQSGLGKDDLDSLESDLKDVRDDTQCYGPILDNATSQTIQNVITVLEYLYNTDRDEDFNADYFLIKNFNQRKHALNTEVNINCVRPAIVFKKIAEQTSTIIITSGTLTPLDSFSVGLKTTFNELSLPQAISRKRYWAAKLTKPPWLTSKNRDDVDVQLDVGNTILKICEIVPNGVLVFCPSKDFILKMTKRWEKSSQTGSVSVMDSIRNVKHVVSECDMKNAESTRRLLMEYREKSREGKGALLLGVHRGKMSEGIDFKDEEARAVINFGIPIAALGSPEALAMKNYYKDADDKFRKWFKTDAFRAVNQASGRVVRHVNDWGAIIMVDPRFAEEKRFISPWIEDASVAYSELERMVEDLRGFIKRAEMNFKS